MSQTEFTTGASRPDERKDERYDAQRTETKWFERWQKEPTLYAAEPHTTKKKFYVLQVVEDQMTIMVPKSLTF